MGGVGGDTHIMFDPPFSLGTCFFLYVVPTAQT